MFKLGIPIRTRHNEVAPSQYEIAPTFEDANLGSDHNQLLWTSCSHRGRAQADVPAARETVRRRERERQAQQLVARDRHRRSLVNPGDPRTRTPSSWSSASPPPGHPPVPGAATRLSGRPGTTTGSERTGPPGHQLRLPGRPAPEPDRQLEAGDAGGAATSGSMIRSAPPTCRRCRGRRGPEPDHPVRVHREQFEFRARSPRIAGGPERGAEHDRGRVARLHRHQTGGRHKGGKPLGTGDRRPPAGHPGGGERSEEGHLQRRRVLGGVAQGGREAGARRTSSRRRTRCRRWSRSRPSR